MTEQNIYQDRTKQNENAQNGRHAYCMHRCIQGPEIRGPSRTGVSTQQSFRVGNELATAQADDNGTVTRCWKGGMSSWCKAANLRKNKWCIPGWVLHEYYTHNSMR